MKRFLQAFLALSLIILAGCTKDAKVTDPVSNNVDTTNQDPFNREVEKKDEAKTIAYEEYYTNDRYIISDEDVVGYGKSATGYMKRYTIYPDGSLSMETYCNYHDNEAGMRVCDSLIIYVSSNQEYITLCAPSSNASIIYYTKGNEEVLDALEALTKEDMREILDTAHDFMVLVDDLNEEDTFVVDYLDKEYLVSDFSYYNAEYEGTYTYSIALDDGYTGYISVEKKNENNQNGSCDISDVSNFSYLESNDFIEMYNSFEG